METSSIKSGEHADTYVLKSLDGVPVQGRRIKITRQRMHSSKESRNTCIASKANEGGPSHPRGMDG